MLRGVHEVEGYFLQLNGQVMFAIFGAILRVITGTIAVDTIGFVIALHPGGAIRVERDGIV